MQPSDADYARLVRVRAELRQLLHESEERAKELGLTPAQHHLLLVVRAHEDPAGPTIGDTAEQLGLRHHSAVELVDRAERAGLVRRVRDRHDHRVVRLRLTPAGRRRLQRLASVHATELRRVEPLLRSVRAAGTARGSRRSG